MLDAPKSHHTPPLRSAPTERLGSFIRRVDSRIDRRRPSIAFLPWRWYLHAERVVTSSRRPRRPRRRLFSRHRFLNLKHEKGIERKKEKEEEDGMILADGSVDLWVPVDRINNHRDSP
jgi:hypothetical protein